MAEQPTSSSSLFPDASKDIAEIFSSKVVGQPLALKVILPYVQMFTAGLAPEGRPAGVFLLLGPTGTGKTRTVEALAEVLHGKDQNVLKIDCGEYQMDHETAKLIGSPPGYLGHGETQALLSQRRVDAMASKKCGLSLVLFDEVEKAAPNFTQLLLGILDRGNLRLGDNTVVRFNKCLIFFTSNLGAREMMREMRPEFGFQAGAAAEGARDAAELAGKLEGIALNAARKRFSPEFINRIDAVITYQPLDHDSLAKILDQHVSDLQKHVQTRLGERCFQIAVSAESREFLLQKGTSLEYGARELKRTIHKYLTQPLATLVAGGKIEAGSCVQAELDAAGEALALHIGPGERPPPPERRSVLLVDDNRDFLQLLDQFVSGAGLEVRTAISVADATAELERQNAAVVVLDYLLSDGNGVKFGLYAHQMHRGIEVIVMTGGNLSPEEEAACEARDIPVLRKPFLVSELVHLIQSRLARSAEARSA